MNSFFKKITDMSGILIQIGIVLIIIGSVFKLLNTPGSDIYITIGATCTVIFSLIAFVEIWLSKSMSVYSKIIWMIFLISFTTLTVLVYFFTRKNSGGISSTANSSVQVI